MSEHEEFEASVAAWVLGALDADEAEEWRIHIEGCTSCRQAAARIRRAVGARAKHVLLQFLVEALTLGLCGGAAGIVVGFIAAFAVTQLLEWPTSVSPAAVALAVGISAATGVFFGFYPARRASHLDPIDALRHE